MTGLGSVPVSRHRRTRSSVHSRGFGRLPDSSSTWAAGLNVMSCWAMAALSAARRVRRTACRVAGPFGFRNGFIPASFRRSSARRARSAAVGRPGLLSLQRVICSVRARFSASITSFWSAMASNISTRWPTWRRSRRRCPMRGFRCTRMCEA
ncbi:hypothetical protein ADK78_10395 [Kitasatospora aureofaciens]|nr:hypothetical protein ADK78_10395 [Kitasatospora aureofaciens]KOT68261.1 hypothetical protein ADK44_01675 [Streptomyces rimosus subsp. rimosus]KOT72840.1 hypothetical protein ADK45_01650 [Streptomyces rimosus subsp. rimosus]KUJ42774.1 hypothetical protein ADK46_03290 [Streptomyces rimosus subsp. rimosus]